MLLLCSHHYKISLNCTVLIMYLTEWNIFMVKASISIFKSKKFGWLIYAITFKVCMWIEGYNSAQWCIFPIYWEGNNHITI